MDGHDDKKRKFDDDGLMDGQLTATLTPEEMKLLLEPFSKEQLISLLSKAAFRYADVAAEINAVASVDPAHRKLFVRGLAWETTTQNLIDAFAQFGDIEEGAVITDRNTGKSRGFGFITFKHMDGAFRALREPSKKIDGRITVCNLAAAGVVNQAAPQVDATQRKVYVGGLSYDTTSEALLAQFSQYGEIEEGSVAYDKVTNKSRGFAFITFKAVDGARKAVAEGSKTIDGRHVVVKIAAEGHRDKSGMQASMGGPGSGQPSMQQGGYGPGQSGSGGMNPYRPQVPPATPVGMAYASPAMAQGFSPAQYSASQYTPGAISQQYGQQQTGQQAPGQQQYSYVTGQAYTPGSIAGVQAGGVPLGMPNGQGSQGGNVQMFYPTGQ